MSGFMPFGKNGSSMLRAACAFAAFVASVPALAQADQAPRVVKVEAFTGSALPPEELQTLESMVCSYVMELKVFRVIDPEGTERSLRELENALQSGDTEAEIRTLAADYLLSGNVGKIGDSYVVTLENVKVASGEKMTVTERCVSVNDIVLKARSITLRLFGRETGLSGGERDAAPEIRLVNSLAEVTGIWKGDKGLDSVRILKTDGTAVAVLTGGTSMRLSVEIENGLLVFRQAEPNRPEFFMSATLPYSRAKLISDRARQVSWTFSLSSDGRTLTGRKESVSVTGDRTGAISVDNTYVREAVWIRAQ
jgi:hypothetical protein